MDQNSEISATGVSAVEATMLLVTVPEAADLLRRSIRTIRYWQAQARMPQRIKVGRRLMYRLHDLKHIGPASGDTKW